MKNFRNEKKYMLNESEIEHLRWCYQRMKNVHGEKHNVDYMAKFEQIVYNKKEFKC